MVAKKKKNVLRKILKKIKKPVKKAPAKLFKRTEGSAGKQMKAPFKRAKKKVTTFSKRALMKYSRKIPPQKEEPGLSIREIDDLIVNMAGEDILPLVNLLRGRENVSEFAIAEKLNVTVNQVRNMLYRLHKSNLVTFTRKKDKKKGWYIYYWTLAIKNIKEALFSQKKRQLADFQEKLAKEIEGKFYVCPGKCARMTMEDAMEADFHCPECGQLMTEQDNKRTVENLQRRIDELSAEIKVEEDARAVEAAKLFARMKKSAARKPKKAAKKAVKKAPVKKEPAKKAVKKAVKKPIKKAVKKAVAKKAVKKIVKKAVKKVVKKAVKKVIVRKPAAKKPEKKGIVIRVPSRSSQAPKGFLSRIFAKKKKK
ncbi:MAG: hypothetical protein QME12_04290 [Nanoarchaeota archaeon]|nr:hypothetical protein [Nanoarchaeota archaeon]